MPLRPEDGRTEPGTDLDLRVERHPRATVIRLSGELDLASVPAVRERLLALAVDGQVNQVLDLTNLTFMDSAGLGVIVATRRRLRTLQGALVLACPNETILRLLRLTSMDKVLPVYPTVDAALEDQFGE